MSEPKVVHEWFGGTGPITNLYRVDEHGAITCQNPNDESEYVKPNLYSVGLELARLAPRVQELEAEVKVMERHELNENTRLREALKAVVDAIAVIPDGALGGYEDGTMVRDEVVARLCAALKVKP